MMILDQDIQLLASQVMSDTDVGGGAATGVVIADGVSNNMFPDVSELDHTIGRVQLRKVFVGVDTPTTDTYLGANVILSKPPGNPDVSAILFSTQDDFDQRAAAASRIEAYLSTGPVYPGELFGNHIEGQSTVTLQQRTSQVEPNVGDTIELVIISGDGVTVAHAQYVRIIDLTSQVRTFTTTDSQGNALDFDRNIISLTIGSTLDADYPGFDPLFIDASVSYAGKTKLYSTVVADAAQYYGIVPLTVAANFGDAGVTGDGIFSQLVPSSRTEVAIPDARMNQQLSALVATGQNVSFTEEIQFDASHPLYVGGGIDPGTLVISLGGASITDSGGSLVNASNVIVGNVDYASGICTLTQSPFGVGAASLTVAYSRAVSTQTVGNTMGLDVTEATRRSTWVVTLDPNPSPGSLQISYLSQGHWYVLQDDGSGALRGADPSFGAGTLNFNTGTVSVTLGALPDAPSEIILAWANGAVPAVSPLEQVAGSTAAVIAIDTGITPMSVGSVTITWDGHTVTDSTSAVGTLQGYGTGTIDHYSGKIVMSPTTLPAVGDVITVTVANLANQGSGEISTLTDSGSTLTGNIGAGALPGSVQMAIQASYPLANSALGDTTTLAGYSVLDDSSGHLFIQTAQVNGTSAQTVIGTIDYTTGAIAITKLTPTVMAQPKYENTLINGQWSIQYKGQQSRTVNVAFTNGTGGFPAIKYVYNVSTLPGSSMTYTVTTLQVKATLSGYQSFTTGTGIGGGVGQTVTHYGTLAPGATFALAGAQYLTDSTGNVQINPSRATGQGTVAGTWAASTGVISVTSWTAGQAATVSAFSAAENPATTVTATNLNTTEVTFRTASAPIASAGFSVRGTLASGVAFNVTAEEDGVIQDTNVFGNIDYDTGVVTIVFGTASAGPAGAGVRDASDLGVPGVAFITLQSANMDSLVYDAVAFSYIPIDPAILGLDPVRLPSDGRVPIFKKGGVAVVHYSNTVAAATHVNGDAINVGTTRLSYLAVIDSAGHEITAGYSVDLDTGIVTVTNVSGWAQPVTVDWRIEDMALIVDAQISGQISLSRPLTHAYPLGSYVSSAYLIGDMQSSVERVFEQQTWTSVWQSTPIGPAIIAGYDTINHPPVVTNAGAATESWALIFTSTTAFEIVGEHLGVVGTGTTAIDCAPLNPNQSVPYFTLAAAGFGTGWAPGNVIRLDTVGATAPLWIGRIVQQGTNTSAEDSFTVLVRGDVNA